MSANTLRMLGAISGTWGTISRFQKSKEVPRISKCFVLYSESCEDGVVLVPPLLSFNIGLSLYDACAIICCSFSEVKTAHDALIYPMACSEHNGGSVANVKQCPAAAVVDSLTAFFSIPRVVMMGDIIGVPLVPHCYSSTTTHFNEDRDFKSSPLLHDGDEGSLLWFKMGVMNPNDSCVVDQTKTTLTQQGKTAQSCVPRAQNALSYLTNQQLEPEEPLDKVVLRQITDLLAPMALSCRDDCFIKNGTTSSPLPIPKVVVYGPYGTGKVKLVREAAAQLGLHVVVRRMSSIFSGIRGYPIQTAVQEAFSAASAVSPSVLVMVGPVRQPGSHNNQSEPLSGKDADEQFSTCLSAYLLNSGTKANVAIVMCENVESLDTVPDDLMRIFTHTVEVSLPSEILRREILLHWLRGCSLSPDVDRTSIDLMSKRLVGRTSIDLRNLIANAGVHALKKKLGGGLWEPNSISSNTLSLPPSSPSVMPSDCFHLSLEDLEKGEQSLPPPASTFFRISTSGAKLGQPRIPTVRWEDVGGQSEVKQEIMDIIDLPLRHPEVLICSIRRRAGVLLYGPPGTGKTLVAKAVATECKIPFFSIKGPELLNMYVGESEHNVREIFAQARRASPCVLFFDELDALAPQRGRGADSGGAMDRVVAQLLAEMDGVSTTATSSSPEKNLVFVIGATNRPDLLDSSLLRPGRFDRLLYMGNNGEKREDILRAVTRRFTFKDGVDIKSVAEMVPSIYTGADMYSIGASAIMRAINRKIKAIEDQVDEINVTTELCNRPPRTVHQLLADMDQDEVQILVSQEDLVEAVITTPPSVTIEELEHYELLRKQFSSSY